MEQSETKTCQNCKQNFEIVQEDFDFYKKMEVPPPTFCPECRLQRRLAWRNERSLHKRTCGRCKKPIITTFSEEGGITTYCNPCWWSDEWDAIQYGVDFDPKRPFLAQLFELMHRVPAVALFGLYPSLVNSEYTNMVGYLKNCYLLTHSDYDEDCHYGSTITNSKNCVDDFFLDKCESVYESVNCRECYRTFFSVDCQSSYDIFFSRNLVGCSNCFGCVNLRNKQYHIFNQPYSKEEYEEKMKELYPNTVSRIEQGWKKVKSLWNEKPQKFMHEYLTVDSTGDYLLNSKNARQSFIAGSLEDSKYCMLITPTPAGTKDSYDFTHFGEASELIYESLMLGWHSRVRFSWFITMQGMDIDYSIWSTGSRNLFGCVGLRNKKYCILNKQYSKEEYEALRKQIIQQMSDVPYVDKQGREYRFGEFFPIEASPYAYNETTAQLYFSLDQKGITDGGYTWREPAERGYVITKKAGELSDSFEFSDSVKNEVVECAHAAPEAGEKGTCGHGCSKAFRFVPAELMFYRQFKLPLPRLCPNCRHVSRVQMTNPPRLWKRRCACGGVKSGAYANIAKHFHSESACPNEFETSYAPERPEIIYCKQCYDAEIV